MGLLRGEGEKPRPGRDRDMERGWTGHFLVPNTSSLSCVWSLYRKERGSEGIQSDFSSVFSLEDESFGQPGEKTGHGLLPANRPAKNNPGRDIPVPGGVRSDETGILLTDENGYSKKERPFFWQKPGNTSPLTP